MNIGKKLFNIAFNLIYISLNSIEQRYNAEIQRLPVNTVAGRFVGLIHTRKKYINFLCSDNKGNCGVKLRHSTRIVSKGRIRETDCHHMCFLSYSDTA